MIFISKKTFTIIKYQEVIINFINTYSVRATTLSKYWLQKLYWIWPNVRLTVIMFLFYCIWNYALISFVTCCGYKIWFYI